MKIELINNTQAWDKEKLCVPDRNRTHDLPNIERALYPQSYEIESTQASYILLGSALSKSISSLFTVGIIISYMQPLDIEARDDSLKYHA